MKRFHFYVPFALAAALLLAPAAQAGQLVAVSKLLEIAAPEPDGYCFHPEGELQYYRFELAALSLGPAGFAVAWKVENSAFTDECYRSSIDGVRVDGRGRPVEKFSASATPVEFVGGPALARLGQDRFVASFWQANGGYWGSATCFRRFRSDAWALDPEAICLGDMRDYRADYGPEMAANPEGRFVMAWWREWQDSTPMLGAPFFQVFDASGEPVMPAVELSAPGCPGNHGDIGDIPRVGMDAAGNVSVFWQKEACSSDPSASRVMWLQRFNRDGLPFGEPRRLGDLPAGVNAIAEDSSGGFVASWWATSNKKLQLLVRRFRADGEAVGPPVEVYRSAPREPRTGLPYISAPVLAQDRLGNTAVSWQVGTRVALAVFDYGLKRQGPVAFDSPIGISPDYFYTSYYRPAVAFGDDGRILTVWLGPKKPGAQDSVLGRFWQIR